MANYDSKIGWIGTIPNHWTLSKVKHYLDDLSAGGTPDSGNTNYWTDSEQGTPWVSITDLTQSPLVKITKKDVTAEGIRAKGLKILPEGTVLYSIFASLGKVGEAGVPLTTNQAIIGLKPSHAMDKVLFKYWLGSIEPYLSYFSSSNTQDNLNAEKVGNIPILVPPLQEQRTIAAFLDHETARIDRLIAKQQRLIELLKEKRQAVISHAVTKGLDPDAPMKDSGVEWLGEVPAHWSLSQPRYLCQFYGGGTPSKDNPAFWNGDIPWVSPKDMKRVVIGEAIDSITMDAIRLSSAKLIPVGSILIVVRGMILDHSVPVAITSAPVTINQDMKAMVCNGKIDPNYYLLCLQGIKDTILDLVESSAHGTKCLRTEQFEKLLIPLPPVDEQKYITKRITDNLTRIDQTIQIASKSIALAQERRTTLISAAVTGKIDLRGWRHPDAA